MDKWLLGAFYGVCAFIGCKAAFWHDRRAMMKVIDKAGKDLAHRIGRQADTGGE